MKKVKDVVCGMMIDPREAVATSEYKGETYYFWAKGCKVAPIPPRLRQSSSSQGNKYS